MNKGYVFMAWHLVKQRENFIFYFIVVKSTTLLSPRSDKIDLLSQDKIINLKHLKTNCEV